MNTLYPGVRSFRPTAELTFDEGFRAGGFWALRSASPEQVRAVSASTTDLTGLTARHTLPDPGTPEAAAFRAGFLTAVREVVHHAGRVRDGSGVWPYGSLQPDATGVVLRLASVLDEGIAIGFRSLGR